MSCRHIQLPTFLSQELNFETSVVRVVHHFLSGLAIRETSPARPKKPKADFDSRGLRHGLDSLGVPFPKRVFPSCSNPLDPTVLRSDSFRDPVKTTSERLARSEVDRGRSKLGSWHWHSTERASKLSATLRFTLSR